MSQQYFYGQMLIFCTNNEGDHLVPDGHWLDYLLARAQAPTPRKVIMFDTKRDMLTEYYGTHKVLTHLTPEERKVSF